MNNQEQTWTVNLKLIRKTAGMTREKMAEQAGVANRQLAGYERGENNWKNMSVSMKHQIETYLNCTLEGLAELDMSLLPEVSCMWQGRVPDCAEVIYAIKMKMVSQKFGTDWRDPYFKNLWRMMPKEVRSTVSVDSLVQMMVAMREDGVGI